MSEMRDIIAAIKPLENIQQPELWKGFSAAIEELQSFFARKNGPGGTSVSN